MTCSSNSRPVALGGWSRAGVGKHTYVAAITCVLVALSLTATPTEGQRLADFKESRHEFDDIVGVRELANGVLLVIDGVARLVGVLNWETDDLRQVGRQGQGPAEYVRPVVAIAMAAESTAVVDAGSTGRVLVVAPDGAIVRAFRWNLGGARGRAPVAGDSMGNFYAPSGAAREVGGITVRAVERWSAQAGKRDTVAFVPQRQARVRRGGAPPPKAVQAFEEENFWAVSRDGVVAVVTSDPFVVSVRRRDGTVATGLPIREAPARVSEFQKRRWIAERESAILVARQTADGGTVYERTTAVAPRAIEWPSRLPPVAAAPVFAADGTMWIERFADDTGATHYDVFDRLGTRQRQVTLVGDVRLSSVGMDYAYAVRRNEDGIQFLRRYVLK